MVILHIANIGDNLANGVHVAVPRHVQAQANLAQVLLVNIRNINVAGDMQCEYKGAESFPDYLPEPFNKPDIAIFHEVNYIEYINNSMIASKASRYNIRGKEVMTLLEKYYLVDLGLLQLKSSPIEKKVGGRLENIVYNELLARGYDVYIGKTDNGEIDFVVDNFGDRFYIQVADYLSSDDVVKREFGAYKSVEDNFPKYVITMDKINYSQNGIIHKNIIEWLLEK